MFRTMIDRFSRLKPIKKLMVGFALATSVLVGGYTLDRAVDADWGQDSSSWTEAQKAQRHHERWQKIGQGLVIVIQALEEANRNAPQQQPTQYPDNYPTTTRDSDWNRQQDNSGYHRENNGGYHRSAPQGQDRSTTKPYQIPPRDQQQQPQVQPPVTQPPVVVAPPPAPPKPTVDWKEKYKHLDDFNDAAKPRQTKPNTYDSGVAKPNNNGNWMNKYKNVTPQKKATSQPANR